MTEAFDWLQPALLWRTDGLDFRQPELFFRPQLLEFRSDTFMEDFLAAASAPQPRAFQAALAVPEQAGKPVKLFQPMHGCFYLVCGSLCCRVPGFPDRDIREREGETVFFVLRKLVNGIEYAWVGKETAKTWQALRSDAKLTLDDEERFPLAATLTASGRSLFFGYLSVASREAYTVSHTELADDATTTDPRVEELRARFVSILTPPTMPPGALSIIDATDDSVALSLSVYVLLDLWEFLSTHLQDVAEALRDNPQMTFSGEQAQAKADLMAFLATQRLNDTVHLAAALGKVARHHAALNQEGGGDLEALNFNEDYNLKGLTSPLHTECLVRKITDALSPTTPGVALPKFDLQAGTRYVLRCVYERPQCDPRAQVISRPTVPFQLAPFFDPDAPARPVRIPLPADVSLAGLRKFKKTVSFMMSDAIRKKAESIMGNEQSLMSDDPPSLNDETTGEFAHICSFSIQIIFIVAFFLLITFVVILNFVFWWIAFFKICLPIPKRLLPG
jgi:hypothetical protein